MSLDELRLKITALDRKLLELVAERQAVSQQIAAVKRSTGLATRDFAREREVLVRARETATGLGLPPQTAEVILRELIRSSLETQELAGVAASGRGGGKRALVIGGLGKMGAWFAEFLASQGFAVSRADPRAGADTDALKARWEDDALDQDVIVVATPLGVTASVMRGLAERRPRGIVFDLGSLKTPLRAELHALLDAGCQVTSLHPMFGPDTRLLSGRHVIFIDLGHADALRQAQDLFAPTMAERVVMGLDEHDRLIAFVLGLSHALNIAFFTALAQSGEAAPRLRRLSSTTFDAQLDVAARVADESPELYYEIQSLNDYGAESLEALRRSVEHLISIVESRDAEGFKRLMHQGRQYFEGRTSHFGG